MIHLANDSKCYVIYRHIEILKSSPINLSGFNVLLWKYDASIYKLISIRFCTIQAHDWSRQFSVLLRFDSSGLTVLAQDFWRCVLRRIDSPVIWTGRPGQDNREFDFIPGQLRENFISFRRDYTIHVEFSHRRKFTSLTYDYAASWPLCHLLATVTYSRRKARI